MDITRLTSELIKVWILVGALGLVAAWTWLPRVYGRRLLIAIALFATLNYARFGPRLLFNQVDTYDLVHYYLNSKYFDELGYFDLYPACILADHENDGPRFKEGNRYLAQDEAGHHVEPISHALARGEEVKASRFTPERWEAFTHDFLVLQREIHGFSSTLWRQMIQDHGFNGTVPWVMIARPISSHVPVELVKLLGFIDLGLLLIGIAAIRWAYGSSAAWWTWLFLMTTYSTRWPTITWALLRYDYVTAMMVGMALVKKGRPFWGGIATGWAGAMRLFPLMWLYGPGMKGIFGLFSRKVHRPLLVLALGTVVGMGALQGAAALLFGTDEIKIHFENMEDHNSAAQLSSRRIGLALALPYRGEWEPKNIEPERKDRVEAQKPLRFALAGAVMLALGFGLRRARDDEAYAMGFVPFFLLTTASYYYYVTRITLVMMHAADMDRLRNRVGLGLLFLVELFSNASETWGTGHRVFQIGWMAWLISLYVLVMLGWFLWESMEEAPLTDPTAPPSPQPAP